jgi:guanylate kinase
MSKPLLLCLIAKSGCGKSTIASRLERKYNYIQAKSYTTRPVREEDENDINTHTFITRAEIENYKDDIVAYNEYNGNAYFATRTMLNNAQIYVVDREGLIQLYKNYHDKDILAIYIDCDSSIASRRMAERGDTDEQIMQRLQYDEKASADCQELCDFVVPNEVQNGVNDIVDWIDATYRYYRVRGK